MHGRASPPSDPVVTIAPPDLSIAARMHRARRRGHPGYLWPDVPISAWRSSLDTIARVVRRQLEDTRDGISPTLTPPPGATAHALGIAAFTSGTGPLLGRWIEDGQMDAPPEVSAVLAEHLHHGRLRADRMRELLFDVLDGLAERGRRALLLKGVHTGPVYFPEAGARTAADIDLAVAGADEGSIAEVLTRLGYRASPRRGQRHRRDWFLPGEGGPFSLELTHASNPIRIEVHTSLDRDFSGIRSFSFSPWEERLRQPWPDHPAADVLAQPLLFVYLATHASDELHRLQLLRLIELALVARRDLASNWAAAGQLIRTLGAGRFIYPALALTERLVPGTVDPDVLRDCVQAAGPRLERAVARIRPAHAHRLEALSLGDRFMFARSPADVLRGTAYLLWPARSRSIGAVYAERVWRLLGGRISLGSPPAD